MDAADDGDGAGRERIRRDEQREGDEARSCRRHHVILARCGRARDRIGRWSEDDGTSDVLTMPAQLALIQSKASHASNIEQSVTDRSHQWAQP